ncbi:alkaline phosphatase D family protein [Streptomyces rochei]|uniref:alkaline phosphatase D family protein n=1 Tax=Streptomyces rochei TaxID=1928 RepID=UPI00371612CF
MTPPRTSSPNSLHRRGFLGIAGAAGAGAVLLGTGAAPVASAAPGRVPRDPFQLGVASGDPLPDGVVLWTRLAPKPLDEDGGMPRRPVAVHWEVALDERFRKVVRRGVEHAVPAEAHTVHADVRGLRPHYEYYYRFRAENVLSPVGRTRTAPAPVPRPPSTSPSPPAPTGSRATSPRTGTWPRSAPTWSSTSATTSTSTPPASTARCAPTTATR